MPATLEKPRTRSARHHRRRWVASILAVVGLLLVGGVIWSTLRPQTPTQELAAALADTTSSARSRCAAAAELGERTPDAAAEPLIAALRDRDRDVQNCVVQALGVHGGGRAVAALSARWKALNRPTADTEDIGTRIRIIQALGRRPDRRAETVLVAALAEVGGESGAASTALAELYRDDVGHLLPLLTSKATFEIYDGLIRLGREGTEGALVRALQRFGWDDAVGSPVYRYLNSGNQELEQAARSWAKAHGLSVVELPSASSGEGGWGSLP